MVDQSDFWSGMNFLHYWGKKLPLSILPNAKCGLWGGDTIPNSLWVLGDLSRMIYVFSPLSLVSCMHILIRILLNTSRRYCAYWWFTLSETPFYWFFQTLSSVSFFSLPLSPLPANSPKKEPGTIVGLPLFISYVSEIFTLMPSVLKTTVSPVLFVCLFVSNGNLQPALYSFIAGMDITLSNIVFI